MTDYRPKHRPAYNPALSDYHTWRHISEEHKKKHEELISNNERNAKQDTQDVSICGGRREPV
jgi:hypothetical protein